MFSPTEETKQGIRAWRDAAVADGWSIEPTYKTESVDRACSLRRGEYHVMILTRDPIPGDQWAQRTAYTIHAWCPKGIALAVPIPYSMEKLCRNEHLCGECGKESMFTHRVGFANRSCPECLPAARKKYEYPGWTN